MAHPSVTKSIMSALAEHGISRESIQTNGYWFIFEYKGFGVCICNQDSRLVGSVYHSISDAQDDYAQHHEIGHIHVDGLPTQSISEALSQAEKGGLQYRDDDELGYEYEDSDLAYSAPAPRGTSCSEFRSFHRETDFYGRTPVQAKIHAHGLGESGWPRWMEPFSKYDVLGQPTVFHPSFGRRRR